MALGRSAWAAAVVALVLLLAAAVVPAAGASAAARHKGTKAPARNLPVPQGFVGVDIDGPVLAPGTTVNLDDQLTAMVANGVQSIRVAFSWADNEPYRSWSHVPSDQKANYTNVSGVPVDFRQTDTIVGEAAQHGISVLPTVLYAPGWDARRNGQGFDIPQRTGPYAAYVTALVGRYGPRGSFWSANPHTHRLPIRSWQIWNEPNLPHYWPQPFAASYAALLRAAHTAIKRADPGATVVLAALTNNAWGALARLYGVPGVRSWFDVVAANAYTKFPANIILFLQLMRDTMNSHGDNAKPLLATELSWPSAVGQHADPVFDFDTTPSGQARDLAQVLPMIGRTYRQLGLGGFDYYSWMGDEFAGASPFHFSGLMRYRNGIVTSKPALAAFRTGALALEGCRSKGQTATDCIR